MGYVLHVWEDPMAVNIVEALSITFDGDRVEVAQNQKFIAFAKALTDAYPDLSAIEEADEGLVGCVWTDSPMDGKTDSSIYVIGIATGQLDGDLLHFVAHAAADQGLHVFDMQAGVLYRPDRSFVDSLGHIANLPPRRPPKRVTLKLAPVLSEDAAVRYLLDSFVEWFPYDGYQLDVDDKNRNLWRAWRQHGEITQGIRFHALKSHGELSVGVDFEFDVAQIDEALKDLAPAKELRLALQRESRRHKTFRIGLAHLFASQDRQDLVNPGDPGHNLEEVRSQEELEQWSGRFNQWFERFGAQQFAVRDLAGLSRLFDSDWHRDVTLRKQTDPEPWFRFLILAHLAQSPKLDSWIENFRFRSKLGSVDRKLWATLREVADFLAPRT